HPCSDAWPRGATGTAVASCCCGSRRFSAWPWSRAPPATHLDEEVGALTDEPERVGSRSPLRGPPPPRGQSAGQLPPPSAIAAARFAISSGGTSSTWVMMLHRCPHGSSI